MAWLGLAWVGSHCISVHVCVCLSLFPAASAALSPAAYKNEDTVGLLASKDEPSTAAAGTAEQQAPQLGPCSCFSLEFYKPVSRCVRLFVCLVAWLVS